MRHRFGLLVPICLSAFFASSALAEPPETAASDSFLQALSDGRPTLDVRYRFENVDQNGFPHASNANTIRTRVGYETGTYENFKALAQIQNILPVGDELYNDGVNGQAGLPLIADPRKTVELYQANVTWSGLPETGLTFGRQAYNLDNQRWIGISDWRQHGQTFDSIVLQNHSISDLDLFYSYLFHVNRVFGPDARVGSGGTAPGMFDMHSHLVNASYSGIPGIKLTGYTYLLDISNSSINSTATFGARFEGKREITDGIDGLFNAEYAHQKSAFNNPARYGFDYYLIEPGVGMGPVAGKIGYEVMEGNGTKALQTPLATGHAFNGWAEKFLTTPTAGLETLYLSSSYTTKDYNDWLGPTVGKFIWYNFNANSSNLHYGNEYDFWLGQTFFKHYTLGLQYADFRADQSAAITDTHKIVVQFQIKY